MRIGRTLLALSSSPRPKNHYRDAPIEHRYTSCDSFAVNEALLLRGVLAYDVRHATPRAC